MTNMTAEPWKIDLGYIELSGLQVKRGDNLVIALHGYLDNANSMMGLADAFPQSHFIALDMAGHGQSAHRGDGSHYNQLDYVQDLYQLIRQLNADTVTLVGHSLGGIVASIFAATFPEHVSALISIDALGPLTKSDKTTASQIREAIQSRASRMMKKPAVKADLDRAAKARADSTDLAEEYCRLILSRNIAQAENDEQVWHSDSRLRTKSWLRLTPQQAQQLMQHITCPMLVIAASTSFKALPQVFKERESWFAQIEFHVLPGGHHIHLEQAQQCQTHIADFVSKL